jgi:hypothetical protein
MHNCHSLKCLPILQLFRRKVRMILRQTRRQTSALTDLCYHRKGIQESFSPSQGFQSFFHRHCTYIHISAYFFPHILPVKETNQYKDKAADFQVSIFLIMAENEEFVEFFSFFFVRAGYQGFLSCIRMF